MQYEEGVAFHTCTLVLASEKMSHPSLSMFQVPETKMNLRCSKVNL